MSIIPMQLKALWIWHPQHHAGSPGYVLFKREFTLSSPGTLECSFSGDNRYILYLDGKVIARGPVRGFVRPLSGKAIHIAGVAPIGRGCLLFVECKKDSNGKWRTGLSVQGGNAVVLLQEPDETAYREIEVVGQPA